MRLVRLWRAGLLHFLLWLLLSFLHTDAHPQCLDYKPPFQPQEPLRFCKEYSKFGCCDLEQDKQISYRFDQIMDYFDHSGFMACGKYIRSILCQVRLRLRPVITVGHHLTKIQRYLWEKTNLTRVRFKNTSVQIVYRNQSCVDQIQMFLKQCLTRSDVYSEDLTWLSLNGSPHVFWMNGRFYAWEWKLLYILYLSDKVTIILKSSTCSKKYRMLIKDMINKKL